MVLALPGQTQDYFYLEAPQVSKRHTDVKCGVRHDITIDTAAPERETSSVLMMSD